MGALTETNVLGLEVESVDKKVDPAFERGDDFLTSLEKESSLTEVSSRDARFPIELRPNGNTGSYVPNGGDMGRGDAPEFDKATIGIVYFVHRVEWTQQSDYSTNSDRKAVLSTFRKLLSTQLDDFRRNLNSFCMQGGNAILATSSAVSAAGGTSGGDRWTCAVAGNGFGVRLLRYNMTVGIYNSTQTIKRGEAKINFWDEVNNLVDTFPAIAGVTAGDVICISGYGTSPTSLFGVPYHHTNSSSGTWLGFSRSTTPEIRANRVNASSNPLALPFPRRAINAIGMRLGMDVLRGNGVRAWMHPAQKQAYEELGQLVSMIQKGPKDEGLDLYFNDNMQMAGAPVSTEFSWDKARIDFIAGKLWTRTEIKKIGFYKNPDTGAKIFPVYGQSGGLAASWIMYYDIGFNIGHRRPAGGAYIDGLTIPSGYPS